MTVPSQNRRYGWRPDLPDVRDRYLPKVGWFKATLLPSSVDMRPQMPPIYDQGEIGSCVANATAAAIEFQRAKEKLSVFVPSRLFIYYNARTIEGDDVTQDTGVQVRNGIKAVVAQGACPESDWLYDVSKFSLQPPQNCYTDAKTDLVISYQRVDQTLNAMQAVLAAGHPFVFGFSVYDSFESQVVAQSGIVPIPQGSENMLGGHCMMVVGYDDSSKTFIVRNSWGADWGQSGYCIMPYDFVTNSDLCSDFWVIQAIGGAA
jgi:C1A family cysteine protease